MEVIDVVRKLIGKVEPVGETNEDERRLKNLKEMITLMDALMFDLNDVSAYRNRVEYSMKEAGKTAQAAINGYTELLTG